MYTCAHCKAIACYTGESNKDKWPKNCPMREGELNREIEQKYLLEENHAFHVASSEIEVLGYCRWPRIKETVEFCKRMGYKKIGLGFCLGLMEEATVVSRIFRDFGLEVVSVVCKTGGISKESIGVPEEHKFKNGEYEAMCNPIAQAELLNQQNTELNVAFGLCVGHDSLFYKYSNAMVTTLVSKDRVLAHNPIGAVYCANVYFKARLTPGYEY